VRSIATIARAAIGRIGRPAFPAPSVLGEGFTYNSGASRRGNAEACLNYRRHCERSEAIHTLFVARWIASLRSQ
jgi:hypothetical protein